MPRPSIIRIDKTCGGYEQIAGRMLREPRLSLDTLGLATWLFSMPDGWQIRVTALPRLLKSKRRGHYGRDRVQRMLRELKAAGYYLPRCFRGPDGRWMWHNVLSDAPLTVTVLAGDGSAVSGSAVAG